jgi:hypothetical protein
MQTADSPTLNGYLNASKIPPNGKPKARLPQARLSRPQILALRRVCRDLKPIVYLDLARRANQNWECWPYVETIANDIGGASVRAVQKALAALERGGLIQIKHRGGPQRSGQKSDLYRVVPTHELPVPKDFRFI